MRPTSLRSCCPRPCRRVPTGPRSNTTAAIVWAVRRRQHTGRCCQSRTASPAGPQEVRVATASRFELVPEPVRFLRRVCLPGFAKADAELQTRRCAGMVIALRQLTSISGHIPPANAIRIPISFQSVPRSPLLPKMRAELKMTPRNEREVRRIADSLRRDYTIKSTGSREDDSPCATS